MGSCGRRSVGLCIPPVIPMDRASSAMAQYVGHVRSELEVGGKFCSVLRRGKYGNNVSGRREGQCHPAPVSMQTGQREGWGWVAKAIFSNPSFWPFVRILNLLHYIVRILIFGR